MIIKKKNKSTEYFKKCAQLIHLLENVMRANLLKLYEVASAGQYVRKLEFLKLEEIA